MTPTIRVYGTPEELAWNAAERFVQSAEDAVVSTGRFVVALSGGTTPQMLFRLLAGDFASKVPWDKTHVLFVDERCVPADHPDSNFGMACRELLDHVPIDYARVHRMAGEQDPQQAAKDYRRILDEQYPKGPDLALLGVGEDGHTASLFPGTAALNETTLSCVANHVPQKGAWRLTMTAGYINRAFDVMILASGAGKAKPIQQALEGIGKVEDCPVRLIAPATGRLVWMMDASAAGMGADTDDADAQFQDASSMTDDMDED